jgi:hypothetical protein
MRAILIALALTLAALSAACGGGSSTGTPTATGSQAIESAAATATQGTAKTVTPLQQTASVAATAPGVTPTAPPVSTQGTPAAIPEDETSFIQSLNGRHTTFSDCAYNPSTDIANCDGVLYSLDPPIVAEAIICTLWHVDGQPYAVSCSARATHFYEIR